MAQYIEDFLPPIQSAGLNTQEAITALAGTATTSGGATAAGIAFGSAALGVYFGSGAPTISAPVGSLYLRSDGSSTITRLYISTNATASWTPVQTVV